MNRYNLIFILSSLFILYSCNTENNKKMNETEKYKESKMTVEQIEKKNPLKFISVSGIDKHNLIGQTIIKGEIVSKATVVVYKDVVVKIVFLSKTGTKLEEDEEVIYDELKPGATVSFKSKFFAPKGTEEVTMSVSGAKAAN